MSEPLPLLFCSHCRATGYINGKTCAACSGKSVGLLSRGIFVYWNFSIDAYHIAFRKIKKQFDAIVNSIIFLLIIACCVMVALTIIEPRALFWGSLAAALLLFVITRLIRYAPEIEEVPEHGFTHESDESSPLQIASWADVRRMKTDRTLNLSSMMSIETIQVLESAYVIAARTRSPQVTNAHLLAALLKNETIQTIFLRLMVRGGDIESKLEPLIASTIGSKIQSSPYISAGVWQSLFAAYELAWNLREPVVANTDLLQVVISADESLQDLLLEFDIKLEALVNVIEWVRVRERVQRQRARRAHGSHGRSTGDTNRAMTSVATPILNAFSEDLTRLSLYGYLEPLVGREREIESIFRILEGGGMSVLLVGEHGVGKRSIINGIADLMVAENVPDQLKDRRLIELNIPKLLAGADPSQAEDRLLQMLTELEQSGNIVLVIPSIEKMVGITIGTSQSMDVASVLTQELGKRNFLTIATTSPDSFNRVIANQALGTVFQKIDIDELDVNSSIRVLEAKAGYIEYKNHIWFSYPAVAEAVAMSARYLHDSYLPSKAIEICNEVALAVYNKRGKNSFVGVQDVAEIISEKTKIPVTAVTEDEGNKLMRLESAMHERVIGQDEAVTLVANALRRSRVELRTGKRPIANFLFLGPTGVGKTELTKTIAEVYFGSEQQMIRLDMSEYQDTNSIYRLIGRPGEQGSGMLTEAVRQKPFALLLLDELEKADPNILNLFLQVMDDGRLTDSVGRVIDFTNVILIATSNAGTSFVQEQMRAGATTDHIKNELIHGELKAQFRPEFLNRFDAIVLFQPLTEEQIGKVARIILHGIEKKLAERGILFEATDAGVTALAAAGFDPEFGARPLRRVIQDRVENAIAGLVLQNQVHRKDTIVVDELGVHVKRV
ncbi:MAG: AAA family ATPase [Candidatus Magasanikbacteria bacterium]|nr:AAA family ATPase [Candidatus Magasanikbacteria bacterium]